VFTSAQWRPDEVSILIDFDGTRATGWIGELGRAVIANSAPKLIDQVYGFLEGPPPASVLVRR
jgi:hypothetical protein